MSDTAIFASLQKFADAVTVKTKALTPGEPEDQLRAPFEVFMEEIGHALALGVVCVGETRLAGRLGKPDYAILMATSENPKLCVTRPIQNAHLPKVNFVFVSATSLDFGVFDRLPP